MKRITRVLFAIVRVAIAVILLLYLAISGTINWSSFRGLTTAWPLLLLALPLGFTAMCMTAWRLCVLLSPRGLHLSFFSAVRLTLISMFFSVCLPGSTGGDLIKIYYAVDGNSGRRTEVATIIILDRAVGMFAIVILPLVIAPFAIQFISSVPVLSGMLALAAAVAALMMAGILISFSLPVRSSRVLTGAFQRLPLGRYAKRVFDTIYLYRHNKSSLLAAVGISLLAQGLTVAMALLVAAAIGPAVFTWKISMLIPFGFLANTVPLTPGGLGVGEAALDKLFKFAGLMHGAETLLGVRLGLILVSLLGLIFYLQGRRDFIRKTQTPPGLSEDLGFEPLYSVKP